AGGSGAATLAPQITGNAEPQLPKLIAANIERGRSKRRYELATEQMLPISVDTMASGGMARSRERSISRGCMRLELAATSSEYGSRSWVQAASSLSQALFSAPMRARRCARVAAPARARALRRAIRACAAARAS